MKGQFLGTLGLITETAAGLVFVGVFVLARLSLARMHLPLPYLFLHCAIVSIFLAFVLGLLGMMLDQRRNRSAITLGLSIPILMVMGVLDGNF